MHDRKDDVRDVGLEALGNKTSQLRERCRGDSGADAGMDGLKRKTAMEGTPEPKKGKRTQATAGEKSIPNRRGKN